jgi:hypothetical protein
MQTASSVLERWSYGGNCPYAIVGKLNQGQSATAEGPLRSEPAQLNAFWVVLTAPVFCFGRTQLLAHTRAQLTPIRTRIDP